MKTGLRVLFRAKNRKLLAGLQDQVDTIRQGQRTPENFYRLEQGMAAYLNFVRDFLDGRATTEERGAAEDQISPAVDALVKEACKLAGEAHKTGGEDLAFLPDYFDSLASCLTFVCHCTKFVVEGG